MSTAAFSWSTRRLVQNHRACAPTADGVRANALSRDSEYFSFKRGGNDALSNQFKISELPETGETLNKLYGATFMFLGAVFFLRLKQFPIYFSCLGECCNAILLENPALGGVDNDWSFIIEPA